MKKNKIKNILFWVGISIVILTHIYMLVAGLPSTQVAAHSVINIIAAGFIVYGKE